MPNIAPELGRLIVDQLPPVLVAAESGDSHRVLIAMRRLIAHLREADPGLADELNRRTFGGRGASQSIRRAPGSDAVSAPEGREQLLTPIDVSEAAMPALAPETSTAIEEFVAENLAADALLKRSLAPRQTLLLEGPPGVGKTMLARWLARRLGLPFLQLELAGAISSYLGQTGQNLHEVLDFARRSRCVLLLDEFDAIAKRRDDRSDLGELKRVVSVLLKEIEDWPGPSIVVAATNHRDLLDPAIFRRFQLTLELGLPDAQRARAIFCQHLAPDSVPEAVAEFAGRVLASSNGSEIREVALSARRRTAIDASTRLDDEVLRLLARRVRAPEARTDFCRIARQVLSRSDASYERLASLLGVSKSTIHAALNRG